MTIPLQPKEGKAYSPAKPTWKWEKRHTLLAVAFICLVLWWFSANLKEASWFPTLAKWLPLIGSLAFAGDTLLKLTQ